MQLQDALARLTGGSGPEATWGGIMGRNIEFPGFVYQNGGKVVDDLFTPTKCLLDTKEALECTQFLVDLDVKQGVSVGDTSRSGGISPANLWTAGRIGIYHTSIWSHKVWARDLQFEWDQVMPANMKAFALAMDYAYPTRVVNGLSVDFYDLTVKQLTPVWAGQQSVPAAMSEVVRQANAMFAAYAAKTK